MTGQTQSLPHGALLLVNPWRQSKQVEWVRGSPSCSPASSLPVLQNLLIFLSTRPSPTAKSCPGPGCALNADAYSRCTFSPLSRWKIPEMGLDFSLASDQRAGLFLNLCSPEFSSLAYWVLLGLSPVLAVAAQWLDDRRCTVQGLAEPGGRGYRSPSL